MITVHKPSYKQKEMENQPEIRTSEPTKPDSNVFWSRRVTSNLRVPVQSKTHLLHHTLDVQQINSTRLVSIQLNDYISFVFVVLFMLQGLPVELPRKPSLSLSIHLIPRWPLLWCSVVFRQITPSCLVLKLEIQKNIFPWTRQQGSICKKTKG